MSKRRPVVWDVLLILFERAQANNRTQDGIDVDKIKGFEAQLRHLEILNNMHIELGGVC